MSASGPDRATTFWPVPYGEVRLRRGFRPRNFDETPLEYRVAWLSQLYNRHRAALWRAFLAALVVSVLYVVWAVQTGAAGLVLGAAPYSAETLAARRAFNASEQFLVYAFPCTPPSNETQPFVRSRPIDWGAFGEFSRSADSEDVRSVVRRSTLLFEANTVDRLPCVCAPLVGYAISMIAFHPALGYAPLMNVALEPLGASRVVRHTQAAHFDARIHFIDNTSDMWVVRPSRVKLTGSLGRHESHALTLDAPLAYCAAECVDLIDGVTIWQRALEQLRSGAEIFDAWRARLERVDCQ